MGIMKMLPTKGVISHVLTNYVIASFCYMTLFVVLYFANISETSSNFEINEEVFDLQKCVTQAELSSDIVFKIQPSIVACAGSCTGNCTTLLVLHEGEVIKCTTANDTISLPVGVSSNNCSTCELGSVNVYTKKYAGVCGNNLVENEHRPLWMLPSGKQALCDPFTDRGNWIVILRRASADVSFHRDWETYKEGFGELTSNYWIGLETVHQLTTQTRHEMRVDLKYKGLNYYAVYTVFNLKDESDGYRLTVGDYTGNATDPMPYHNGEVFSTYDNPGSSNCARVYEGAGWESSCHRMFLFGNWGMKSHSGMNWYPLTGFRDSVEFCEMKIRSLE